MKDSRRNGFNFPLSRYQILLWVLMVLQIVISELCILQALEYPYNVLFI